MATQLIRSLQAIPSKAKHGVVTLGNFDGVHLGHQMLLKQTVDIAKKLACPSVVVTFNPHPYAYFPAKKSLVLLSSMREKVLLMQQLGIDYLIVIQFNQVVASMAAPDFVKTVLFDALAAKHIVIGNDFRFGCKRQGDTALLKSLGETYRFTVDAMPQYDYKGVRISSTRVREALKMGDLPLVRHLLGRPYTVTQRIQHGDALGRRLGYPTINLPWHTVPPITGIYVVLVHGIEATPILGAASSGTRPTVDGTRALLEVHLLDFDRIIYGRRVTVEFCHKLREEAYFTSLDALKAQIAIDVAKTRAYFTGKK